MASKKIKVQYIATKATPRIEVVPPVDLDPYPLTIVTFN